MNVFSYVVDHDYGREPNPYDGICTLCRCKYGETLEKSNGQEGHKNIVELAKRGDWIIGTGGADMKKSAGHGKLIYAMQVDMTLTGAECIAYKRFKKRLHIDSLTDFQKNKQFALISEHFYYFGSKPFNNQPIDISEFNLEKNPRGFHYVNSVDFIQFHEWLTKRYKPGIHGEPHGKSVEERKGSNRCKSSC